MSDGKRYCQNCGIELHGEFCSFCGQRDRDIHVPVKELASEIVELIPAFDKRLLRTIGSFLFHPGFLTKEYLSGKRKYYLSPFKFYFTVSFLFFFVNTFNDSDVKKNPRSDYLKTDSLKTVIIGDSSNISIRSNTSGISFSLSDTAQMEKLFGKNFIEGFKSGRSNPRMFFDLIRVQLPRIVFLLLPVFALLLKIVYIRSNLLYIQHLIFSFNFHSYIFFILLCKICIEMITPKGFRLYESIIYLAIPIYLYFGLRYLYKQSQWKTIVKFILLSLSHAVVFIMTLGMFVIATIVIFFT